MPQQSDIWDVVRAVSLGRVGDRAPGGVRGTVPPGLIWALSIQDEMTSIELYYEPWDSACREGLFDTCQRLPRFAIHPHANSNWETALLIR
jgi:hypothetical protein